MLSIVHEDEVLDFKYKKQSNREYTFYIGDILIGTLFKRSKNRWCAVSHHPNAKGHEDGFGSRYLASEYLLRINGFLDSQEDKDFKKDSKERFESLINKYRKVLLSRVDNYLGNGGLFNPEHMNHEEVRNLIVDLRKSLSIEPEQLKLIEKVKERFLLVAKFNKDLSEKYYSDIFKVIYSSFKVSVDIISEEEKKILS
jgi:hypothetical protein